MPIINRSNQSWTLRRALFPALLALVVLSTACTTGDDTSADNSSDAAGGASDDGAAAGDTDAETDAEADGAGRSVPADDVELVASYEPFYVESPCPFIEPDDTAPLCGTVTVPVDWTDPDGGSVIEMPFAIFAGPTEAEGGQLDPVVYLEGGPGSHTLETIPFSFDEIFRPLTEQRDLIVFDQRGAGESEPRVDCPETDDLERFLADNPDTSDDETLELTLDAVDTCRQRLSDVGIDLTNYDTAQNARDVEALRLALGYDEWNLYGISYGTRLGLEVLRRFPDTVRSAVLDSVYPPNADSISENPGTFVDAFEAVAAACAAEAACAEQGDVAERVQDLVVELEANPLPATVDNWLTGESDDVFVDGNILQGVIVQALYNPFNFTDLPEVLTDLEAGEVGAIEAYLSQSRTNGEFFSDGMFYALVCRDEVAFADADEVDAELPESPFEPGEPFDIGINVGPVAFELCQSLDVGSAEADVTEAVVSDVPTLLLAGAYDPVTPVSWAELALETLSAGQLIVAPNGSHAVTADSCGIAIAAEFLDDPTGTPDASCFDDQGLQFIGPPAGPIELETVTQADGTGGQPIVVVQPADWGPGGLDGHRVRGASILDNAQIYQVADSSVFLPIIAQFVESTEGITLDASVPFGPGDQIGSLDGSELDFGWSRRSYADDEVVVEWFERSLGASSMLIGLVAPAEEADELIEEVLVPALQGFAVEPA